MSAEDAVELLTKLRDILSERTYFQYNSSLINPFSKQLSYINTILTKYKPTDDVSKNILDLHGISILNSILEINDISRNFSDKFTSNISKCDDEYTNELQNLDNSFITLMNSKGYNGDDELTRVKIMLADFATGETRIKSIRLQSNLYRDNITEAFDYHLLIYLIMCLETENAIYKKMRQKTTDGYVDKFHDISSCRSSCVGLCAASCDETCYGCGSSCSGECSSACGECANSCTVTCNHNCNNGCSHDCNGCDSTCTGCVASCLNTCGDSCKDECGKCDASCYGSTSGAVVTCGCGSTCMSNCSTTCDGASNKPSIINPDPDPPIITEPDPTPDPSVPTPSSSSSNPNYPHSGWVPTTDGKGYYEYTDANGNRYRTNEMSSSANGSTGNYTTPWNGSQSNHQYYADSSYNNHGSSSGSNWYDRGNNSDGSAYQGNNRNK